MQKGRRSLRNEKGITNLDLLSTLSVALLLLTTKHIISTKHAYIIAPMSNSKSEAVHHPGKMCCANIERKLPLFH